MARAVAGGWAHAIDCSLGLFFRIPVPTASRPRPSPSAAAAVAAVDASDNSFRFYSGGIYSRPDCATQASDLDHAVIISGYGTAADGTPYWLVKNIWSPYWVGGSGVCVWRGAGGAFSEACTRLRHAWSRVEG